MAKLYWDEPQNQKYQTTVCFIHNYGGNYKSTKRARLFFLELGFRCLTIELSHSQPKLSSAFHRFPFSFQNYGLRLLWKDEIIKALETISGPYLMYSLSFPSHAAHAALAESPQSQKVGWICEGGPFVNMFYCTWNLFTYAYTVKNPLLRSLQVLFSLFVLGGWFQYYKDVKRYFTQLPENFPILTFQATADDLVPPYCIQEYFDLRKNKKHTKTVLLEGINHLKGFRSQTKTVQKEIKIFLKNSNIV